MKVIYNSKLFRLPLLRNYSAIVLGRRCYVKAGEASPVLLQHERIHQAQMDRHGMITFYIMYIGDYARNLLRFRNHDQAYQAIRFEVEAYQYEADPHLPSEIARKKGENISR